VVNVSTAVFDLGIEERRIARQSVRIYSLARTITELARALQQPESRVEATEALTSTAVLSLPRWITGS
jgi:hypothetical protein